MRQRLGSLFRTTTFWLVASVAGVVVASVLALLAYVYVDSLFVNAELIRQGYAQVSTYKDNQRYHAEFEQLQQHAIATRRGMWGGCLELHRPQESTPSTPQAAKKRR